MHADFSVELGRDDPALELPWRSDDPQVRYYDLKTYPELVTQIPEAVAYPQLSAFLTRINVAGFPLATAKCDAWESREVTPEEEIFGDRKFVSYVDLVFEDEAPRTSLEKHETFAEGICRLLARAPEIAATVELVIRRCYYHGSSVGGTGWGEREDETEIDRGRRRVSVAGEGMDRGGEAADFDEAQISAGETGPGARQSDCPMDESASERRGLSKLVGRVDDGVASGEDDTVDGFCITVYVTGFGDQENEPRLRWEVALVLLQNALVQLAKSV